MWRGVLVGLLLVWLAVGCRADALTDAFRADTRDQGSLALALARQALDYACRTREPLPLPADLPDLLTRRGAAFVSAQVKGTGVPRCCMGTLTPVQPTLAEEIIANAYLAATADKRFAPLQPADLARIRVIVSIIGDVAPCNDPTALNPLLDGLAARSTADTGVVLPGEARDAATMLTWARIRARARIEDPIDYFRLDAVRYLESPPTKEVAHAPSAH